jgi:uncharacterized protein (AIM24 family)
MAEAASYTCPWCKRAFDASSSSCPACGAPVDVRKLTTPSGWNELPAIKDMAKIQFGQSFCQVEGNFVPVANFKLAAGDGVYFAHHLMLWKDDHAQITAMPLKGAWKRVLAGMPLVMTQATGPGRIAFSKDKPGEVIAIPLDVGRSMDVREHVFMVATHSVSYDWFSSGIWYRTREDKNVETHYPIGMFMDRFGAAGKEGLLLLHGAGNVFVRDLQPGQSILIKPTALLFKETTVHMNLHFEYPSGIWNPYGTWNVGTVWSNRYVWLRLTGPGRVGVQSNFDKIDDRGHPLVDFEANATEVQW